MNFIGQLYLTLIPVILAGIANMMFCKSDIFAHWATPIDCGRNAPDGHRWFGDNKTWKGFWGMVFWTALIELLWGSLISLQPHWQSYHLVYPTVHHTPLFHLQFGALLGLAYVLFELPNSFIKRRLAITPGELAQGSYRWIGYVIDQIDSLIGVGLVVSLWHPLSGMQWCIFLLIGALTHIGVNLCLYHYRLRRHRN